MTAIVRGTGETVEASTRGQPSIISANLLYLATMILVLLVGSTLQSRHFGWGLFLTEIGLLLLPALLWFRRSNLSLRETARLRWPGWVPVLLGLLLGVGLWFLDSWLGALASALLGYDVLPPAGSYPTTGGQAALVFVAFALAAPVAEEILFRGYMQPAYERLGPGRAIFLVGLLFALFHLSLVGLPPRLPIAFALGYVAWRSNSLFPAIALHLANNALGALFLIGIGLRLDNLAALPAGGLLLATVGVLLTASALWAFHRATRAALRPAPPAVTPARSRLTHTWPLLLALLIWLGIAGLEVVQGRAPQLLAFGQSLELTEASRQPANWHYQLQNVAEENVGEAVCAYQPSAATVTLECTLENEAFEIKQGNSYWSSDARTITLSATWNAEPMALLAAEIQDGGSNSKLVTTAERREGEILIAVSGTRSGTGTTVVSPPLLLDGVWPWQLSALPFGLGLVREANLVYPSRWDPTLNTSTIAVTTAAVVVHGVEPLSTPAGDFMAWRVTVDDNTAWYDVQAPHTLLKYDDGFLTYILTE